MNVEEKLKNNHGFVFDTDIDEIINEFGDDYEVVIKCYCHNRQLISLKDLKELPKTNPILNDDIREIFITTDEYERMFTKGE